MKIINTITKEVDTVNNAQALKVIARTDGLWEQYNETPPSPKPPAIKKQVVKKKRVVKKKSIKKRK